MLRRKLFTLAAVASAVLCVALCVLWVRSRLVRDYGWAWLPWPHDAAGQRRWIKLDADGGAGQVELSWRVWTDAEGTQVIRHNELAAANFYHRTFPEVPLEYARSSPPSPWNAAGFGWYSGPTHTSVWLPYWSAALLTAVPPTWWAAARARRRRRVRA